MTDHTAPVNEAMRIQSLDVLRGVALCGILLLNIIGFGMHSAAYFNPVIDGATQGINFVTWASVDIMFEGSMRCLFSILFGAGVVLFTDSGKGASLHFRRNFWLLMLGLFDVYILLWTGDILVTYAIAGALLYFARGLKPSRLITVSLVLITMLSVQYYITGIGLNSVRELATAEQPTDAVLTTDDKQQIQIWEDFRKDFDSNPAEIASELAIRQGGYLANFRFVVSKSADLLLLQIPVYLLWDALAMMMLGMALYKMGFLNAGLQPRVYALAALCGFTTGLTCNVYEVAITINSGFDLLAGFSFVQPTYQVGRLGMAMGYLSLIMLACQLDWLPWLRQRLAALGRMALTNYLGHSLICLVFFVGFAMVGKLERWMLYPVVVAIWLFQLFFSYWWLERFRFGPVEWLWRVLTYGELQKMRR
jgi:uncharacterized protein